MVIRVRPVKLWKVWCVVRGHEPGELEPGITSVRRCVRCGQELAYSGRVVSPAEEHLRGELELRDDLLREIGRNETAMRVLDTAQLPGSGTMGALIRTLVQVEVPPFVDTKGQAPPLGAEWAKEEEGSGGT